ncbi:MAG: hypothetical protein VX546_07565 [Myxococcota bacterium]|nr:hypothetical protein [Myxococcota bacterium]
MRVLERARVTLGLLSLAASLALLSPGVRAEPATEAGSCRASTSSSDAEVQAFVEHLRRERSVSADSAGEIVALNNRGYNYGPPPQVELDEILVELRNRR